MSYLDAPDPAALVHQAGFAALDQHYLLRAMLEPPQELISQLYPFVEPLYKTMHEVRSFG